MQKFRYTVEVEAESAELAERALWERIGPDEDYGFDYTIGLVPASSTTDNPLREAIERIERMRDAAEHDRLIVYVKNVTFDKLTEDELREFGYGDYLANEPGRHALKSLLLGYDVASSLPLERLRELFEQDDYSAWEMFDSEDTEHFENDEGSIAAYDRVLDVLQVLAHGLTPAQGGEES